MNHAKQLTFPWYFSMKQENMWCITPNFRQEAADQNAGDKTSLMSVDEIIVRLKDRMVQHKTSIRKAFQFYDTSGKGKIRKKDFRQVFDIWIENPKLLNNYSCLSASIEQKIVFCRWWQALECTWVMNSLRSYAHVLISIMVTWRTRVSSIILRILGIQVWNCSNSVS